MIEKFENTVRNRWFQHVLFWVFSYIVLWTIFAHVEDFAAVDFIYTGLFHISLVTVVYINLRLLIPKYLRQRSYAIYFVLVILVVIFGVFINNITFNYLADILFPGYYFIESYGVKDLSKFVVVYIIVSSLLKFSKSWFRQFETEQRLIKMEKEKKDAELGALKAQVSPHFLLNSLNSLYSMALDGDERTADIVLLISDMLKYVLYETNSDKVKLEREVNHVSNYVELQKLRRLSDCKIEFEIEGTPNEKQIAPLLFLPLVENAFKHGGVSDDGESFVIIKLTINEQGLSFKVDNSKGGLSVLELNRAGGLGLMNLRQRLDLLYPAAYMIDVSDFQNYYSVVLKIEFAHDKLHSDR